MSFIWIFFPDSARRRLGKRPRAQNVQLSIGVKRKKVSHENSWSIFSLQMPQQWKLNFISPLEFSLNSRRDREMDFRSSFGRWAEVQACHLQKIIVSQVSTTNLTAQINCGKCSEWSGSHLNAAHQIDCLFCFLVLVYWVITHDTVSHHIKTPQGLNETETKSRNAKTITRN